MLMGLAGMACNFGAMILLPMAEATTISLSVPIFAVIFAAILLGEATGWQRWSAVILGFVGVLVVLDPLSSFAGGFGGDRKSVVSGKRVSVRVDLGGRRIIQKKKIK